MNDIVTNLKKLCEEHEKHLTSIRQRINEIELYPQAKALVGKCFKCPLDYTSGFGFFGTTVRARRKRNVGAIYKRIIGHLQDYVIVDTLEIHKSGHIEIKIHEKEYVSHFSNKSFIEITEKQYFLAFNKMLKYIFETGKKEN